MAYPVKESPSQNLSRDISSSKASFMALYVAASCVSHREPGILSGMSWVLGDRGGGGWCGKPRRGRSTRSESEHTDGSCGPAMTPEEELPQAGLYSGP